MATAADPESLRQKLEDQSISAVVIDVGREIGGTMTVLRIMKRFPTIPLFIFNGFMLPRIEEKTREYDLVHYYESQNQLDDFIAMVLAVVDRKKPAVSRGISLPQFLQLMNIEKWNGRVTITTGADQGILYLQDGRLVGAATGKLTGHDAWDKMASWENVSVETLSGRLPADIPGACIHQPAPAINKNAVLAPGTNSAQGNAGIIETLHLIRQNRRITLNLKTLNLAIEAIRDVLLTSLLRTDIFLSNNSLSLAGWNSHPLACSKFAIITRSLIASLQLSGFPSLGAYYLMDLNDDQLLFMVVTDELQWGFLLQGVKNRLGLLLNIVLPQALKALAECLSVQNNV